MSQKEAKRDLSIVHIGIVFLLMFVLPNFIQPVGSLTKGGAEILCVFAGLIYGWGSAGLLIPSFMGLIALGFTELYTVTGIVIQAFGNDMVIFTLLVFILVGALTECGAIDFFAKYILSRKIFAGRPWAFSLVMMLVTAVLTCISNHFVAMFFTWGIFYSIFKRHDFAPYSKYVTLMMFGVVVGVTLGSFLLPFRSTPMLMSVSFMAMSPESGTPNYIAYLVAVLPLIALFFAEYIFICKNIFKADVSSLKDFDNTALFNSDEKLDARQIICFAAFLLMLLGIFLSNVLPAGNVVKAFLGNLGFSGIAFVLLSLLLIIRIDGAPVINFSEVAKNHVVWEGFFMVVMVMLLSPVLSNPETGISAFIVELLSPVFVGHSPFVFLMIFAGALFFLTNFFNNMVMGFLFMNIIAAFAAPLGIDPWLMMTLLIVAMHLAILCPSSTGNVAILFGLTDWVQPKDLYKVTITTFAIWGVTFLTVGILYVKFIFSMFS